MKKIISSLLSFTLVLSFFTTSIFAQENNDTTEEYKEISLNEKNNYEYEMDWENITEIRFMYVESNDPIYLEAVKRNIPVVIEGYISSSFFRNFTYFSSISWIFRDRGKSLSLIPKNGRKIDKEKAWQEAVRFFQNHPMYTSESNPSKYSSMRNQYLCHVDFASWKRDWNLEPWVADKGYNGFVFSGCN